MNDLTIKLGLDDAELPAPVQRVNRAIGSIGQAGEISARQTAAAMRMLPMQFTDVATQLAGGQSLGLVLMQQGGQIKDSFGGAGNAIRAISGAISPVMLGVGALAGTVGALALAAHQARQEQTLFERTLIETGNTLGVTTDGLQEMARGIGKLAGTRGQAVEALVQMAKASNVAAVNLQDFTASAVRLEQAGGAAVDDTAKAFAKLAKDPVAATRELGLQLGYLTPRIFENVAALAAQGREAEAVRVAQKAYADAIDQVAQRLRATQGLMNEAKESARGFWDELSDVFRARTVVQQLEQVNLQLARNRSLGRGDAVIAGLGSVNEGLAGQRAALNRTLLNATELDAGQRSARDLAAAYADARVQVTRWAEAGKSNADKLTAALKQYADQVKLIREQGGLVSSEDERRGIAAIRDQYTERTKRDPWAGVQIVPQEWQRQYAQMQAQQRGLDALIQESLLKDDERRNQRLTKEAAFLQQLVDVNARTSVELIGDERARAEAIIKLERDIQIRRLQEMNLGSNARAQAEAEIEEQARLKRLALEEKMAAEGGRTTLETTRGALAAAFRDTSGNPLKAFGNALASTIYTRATSSLVDALAVAAVGRDGRGGLLGDFLGFVGSIGGGGYTVDPNGRGMNAPDITGTRGGMATGTNYVPKNMFAFLHEGEAIVPKRYNPAAGGRQPTQASGQALQITNVYHIDARSDREQLLRDMVDISRQGNEALVEDLRSRGLIVA